MKTRYASSITIVVLFVGLPTNALALEPVAQVNRFAKLVDGAEDTAHCTASRTGDGH